MIKRTTTDNEVAPTIPTIEDIDSVSISTSLQFECFYEDRSKVSLKRNIGLLLVVAISPIAEEFFGYNRISI